MKRLLPLVALAAFCALPVFAQDAPPPEGDAAAPADDAAPVEGDAAAAEGDAAPAEGDAAAAPVEGDAAAAPADLQTAEEEYDLRVRDLEGKINDLKEQIFRSKAKLTLLTKAVTEGGLGQGARATIVHRNEMGGTFVLTEVNYFLDAAPLWQQIDETGDTLTGIEKKEVWSGNIVEGSHTLTVTMVYRGSGFGIFSYLEGYTFRLKDSVAFNAEPGKTIYIESIGFEQGNFTTEITERPSIRFDTKLDVNQGAPKE